MFWKPNLFLATAKKRQVYNSKQNDFVSITVALTVPFVNMFSPGK